MKRFKKQIAFGVAILLIFIIAIPMTFNNNLGVKYGKAIAATSSGKGSGIIIKSLTAFQKNTLFKLCKVWGFAKYYHPKVAVGSINWDYALFKIMPKMLALKSDKDVNKALYQWINSLGTVKKGAANKESGEITIKADTNWIRDTKFVGSDLSRLLIKIQSADRLSINHYVILADNVCNPVFINENSYSTMNFKDDGIKLLGLFRYWNMIEYFSPYRDIIDEDWNTVLKNFIPVMIKCDTDLSYKLTVCDLIGKVEDGHANMYSADKTFKALLGNNIVPIKIKIVEDKVVVVEKWDQLSKDADIKVGDVILKINSRDVNDLIKEKLRYMPKANKVSNRPNFLSTLLRTNDEYLNLEIERDGSVIKSKIKCTNDLGVIDQIYENTLISSHKLLNGNIGYIYAAKLGENEIDSIMSEFKNTKGLIIDLRCYPSAFIPFTLGKYLTKTPIKFVKISRGSIQTPGEFRFHKEYYIGENYPDCYKGKVIIMVNDDAISCAEYTTMALKAAPNVTVIGGNTCGADGNVSLITLPGNIQTYISGIGIYYPDGGQTQRIGIKPDIEVKPTIKGIRSGIDEVLEKAIELINK